MDQSLLLQHPEFQDPSPAVWQMDLVALEVETQPFLIPEGPVRVQVPQGSKCPTIRYLPKTIITIPNMETLKN